MNTEFLENIERELEDKKDGFKECLKIDSKIDDEAEFKDLCRLLSARSPEDIGDFCKARDLDYKTARSYLKAYRTWRAYKECFLLAKKFEEIKSSVRVVKKFFGSDFI